MSAQDDRVRSMLFQHPRYIPISVGILPAVWMRHRERLDELVRRHPVIFGPDQPAGRDYDDIARKTYHAGDHVDAWGCVWRNIRAGMEAMVKGHPLPTRASVRRLKAPKEDIGLPHGFMYLRLCDLRGFEEMMLDFADQPPELPLLIDAVLDYNLRQVDKILAGKDPRQPEILGFGDDLGMQTGLPIGPERWRRWLKPCYARLFGRMRQAGHWVYMHSDGCIWEIIPDLIDCGVNVINPQIGANGLDNLASACKGKVCVDLDLDRQKFPFFSLDQIGDHVRQAVETLGSPAGGLWLKAEIGPELSLETIECICSTLEKYRGHFA